MVSLFSRHSLVPARSLSLSLSLPPLSHFLLHPPSLPPISPISPSLSPISSSLSSLSFSLSSHLPLSLLPSLPPADSDVSLSLSFSFFSLALPLSLSLSIWCPALHFCVCVCEIGRAHVCTTVTLESRIVFSASQK